MASLNDVNPDALTLPLPSQKVARIDGLQSLRMVAVLLVAWMHAGQPLAASGLALPDLGMFGVDIFFVISGFILSFIVLRSDPSPSLRSSLDFLRRRAIRIFPIYWLFALFPMAHQFHVHKGPLYLPAFFLLSGFQYPDLPTLANFSWTLIFEMFFYLLLGIFLIFFARRIAVLAMIFTLGLLVTIGTVVDIQRPVLIISMNPIMLEFAMGATVALIYSRINRSPLLGWFLLIVGIVGALSIHVLQHNRTFEMDILTNHGAMERTFTWGLAATLIVLGTVLASPRMQSPIGKLSVLLGNASYSTYLLSGFIFLRFAYAIAQVNRFVHGRITLAFFQVFLTMAMMALGLALYICIEKRLLAAANRLVPVLKKG